MSISPNNNDKSHSQEKRLLVTDAPLSSSGAVNASIISRTVDLFKTVYTSPIVQNLKLAAIAFYSGYYARADYQNIQEISIKIGRQGTRPNRRARRLLKQLKAAKFDFAKNVISTVGYTGQLVFSVNAKSIEATYLVAYHLLGVTKEIPIEQSNLVRRISNVAVDALGITASMCNIAVLAGKKDPDDPMTHYLNLVYTIAYYSKFALERSAIM